MSPLKLNEQNAAINRAIGDRILETYPDAEVVRDGDIYRFISLVHGGIRYDFKARKTGRFAMAARPLATPLQPHELLGMSAQDYVHLLNPSLPRANAVKPKSSSGGKFRLYRCGDCLAVAGTDLEEPYILLSRHSSAGATMSAARLADATANILYDETLKTEFLTYYGRDHYESKVLPNLFNAAPKDENKQRPDRRIPNAVLNVVTAGLTRYLEESEDPVRDAASYLDGTHSAARLLSETAISNLWHADGEYRDRLVGLAVKAHYLNRWVEVEPRKWKFIIFQDLEKDAGKLISDWKRK